MKEQSPNSMEFNFQGSYSPKTGKSSVAEDPLTQDPTAVTFKGPERPKNYSYSSNPTSSGFSAQKESASKTATPMNNPAPIHARENIARQKREQRTMNVILGSAASTVFLSILVVAALAALGGYVLWKQIQQQSATISLLEVSLRQEMVMLRDDLEKADQQINKNLFRVQSILDDQQNIVKSAQLSVQTQSDKNQRQDIQLQQLDSRLRELEKFRYKR
ncbi:MAG: hypothetical protein ACOY3I_03045 [Verrucomicrobiota bacterium]